LQEVVSQLNDYFQEREPVLIVNLSSRHRFPSLGCFTRYPFGKTRTYLEQAKILGDVKAIRAVASANGNHFGL
jgi:methylated-DNA-[protein]-cysteine S-methyltransferase